MLSAHIPVVQCTDLEHYHPCCNTTAFLPLAYAFPAKGVTDPFVQRRTTKQAHQAHVHCSFTASAQLHRRTATSATLLHLKLNVGSPLEVLQVTTLCIEPDQVPEAVEGAHKAAQ
jgi:hypothetical protein